MTATTGDFEAETAGRVNARPIRGATDMGTLILLKAAGGDQPLDAETIARRAAAEAAVQARYADVRAAGDALGNSMAHARECGRRGAIVVQLRDALARFGVCREWCRTWTSGSCNCGFVEARRIGADVKAGL